MSHRLFVGSLSWNTDDDRLRTAFAEHATVLDAKVITERGSDRSRGFGFVTVETADGAERARGALHGEKLDGRKMRVAKAKPRGRSGGGQRHRARPGVTRGYPMSGGW